MAAVGILGGSGFYGLEGLAGAREESVRTPFGDPSAVLLCGRLHGVDLVFLPRHGPGHRLLPSEINYRANVHALRQLGVERVISVSAVGSMREAIRPGDLVLPDQLIDRTTRRESTFFGEGVAGHVGFADPVCDELAGIVHAAALASGLEDGAGVDRGSAADSGARRQRVYRGGTYVCMEGPQFSTRAESLLHRSWGVDLIGMTAATEAKLCREAELCFVSLALATDYDCWHPAEAAVTADGVVAVLRANVERAKSIVRAAVATLPAVRRCGCGDAARNAVLTARDTIPPEARVRLNLLFGRYL